MAALSDCDGFILHFASLKAETMIVLLHTRVGMQHLQLYAVCQWIYIKVLIIVDTSGSSCFYGALHCIYWTSERPVKVNESTVYHIS